MLPSNILLMLYYSMIFPHLNYCNIIWGNTYTSYMDKIYLLQKRAIRIITKSEYLAPSRPLFVKMHILPIFQLIQLNIRIFMFKFQNGLLPEIPNLNFITNSDIHSYSTRQKNDLHLFKVRTTNAQNSFYVNSIKEWNYLSNDVKESKTPSRFKLQCTQLLFND